MPELSTILLFSLASLALAATPGPDMLLIAARSAAQGRTAGFATYFGVATGALCHALASAVGLSQLFLAVPFAYDLVRYLGALYLLFLAWQAFRATDEQHRAGVKVRHHRTSVMFRQGFLSNILNPKVALFFLALFPQFIEPEQGSLFGQFMVLALVLNVVGLIVNGIVVLIASRAAVLATANRRYRQISRYCLGTVFAGLALRLALDRSTPG